MTELCKIMKDRGSDKGDSWHNYTTFYSEIFEEKRDQIENIFEVGIGTTNPAFQSHMKPEFTPGGSLRGWRDYFTNANVYGADIDRDILFEEERIKCFYVDQLKAAYIQYMWESSGLEDTKFDIIIDDGLHTLPAAIELFANSKDKLKEDGIYIIEDVQNHWIDDYNTAFADVLDEDHRMFVKTIPHHENTTDNTLILIIHGSDSTYVKHLEGNYE